jgi:hypothetical protein
MDGLLMNHHKEAKLSKKFKGKNTSSTHSQKRQRLTTNEFKWIVTQ